REAWRRRGNYRDRGIGDNLVDVAERNEVFTNVLIRRYRPRVYNAPIAVMRTRQGRLMAFGRRDLGWTSVTKGDVRIIGVPGAHISLLDPPHSLSVVEAIVNWLRHG